MVPPLTKAVVRLAHDLAAWCRRAHDLAPADEGSQLEQTSALLSGLGPSRSASRHVVVDAILGIRCGYDPTVRNLSELPHDVLLRIFSTLSVQSLCSLAQVSKCVNSLADDSSLWQAACGCNVQAELGVDACCKEHVRDDHLQQLQCEALIRLMRREERRRLHQARWRKLKQLFLPLLQTAFVLIVLFWPWDPAPKASGASKPDAQAPCGEVHYQYATWDPRHALSPTVRSAAE